MADSGQHNPLHCSFCAKNDKQVAQLIAGPGGVFICDECVALCMEIIATNKSAPPFFADMEDASFASIDDLLAAGGFEHSPGPVNALAVYTAITKAIAAEFQKRKEAKNRATAIEKIAGQIREQETRLDVELKPLRDLLTSLEAGGPIPAELITPSREIGQRIISG